MILSKVRRELSTASDEEKRQAGLRYFREEVSLYGIPSYIVKQIASEKQVIQVRSSLP